MCSASPQCSAGNGNPAHSEQSLLAFVAEWYTDIVVRDTRNLGVTIAPYR